MYLVSHWHELYTQFLNSFEILLCLKIGKCYLYKIFHKKIINGRLLLTVIGEKKKLNCEYKLELITIYNLLWMYYKNIVNVILLSK